MSGWHMVNLTRTTPILPLATALALVCAGTRAAAPASEQSWTFRALLDGRDIGRHEFEVRDRGAIRTVHSAASFDVRLLFVHLYRYRHEAEETWEGDCLTGLRSSTVTNGNTEHVEARRSGGELLVDRGTLQERHAGCVMSFAYWTPKILRATALLNSQTGELLPVAVTALGTQRVELGGRGMAADHYRLSTPKFEIELWYAGDRWVGLEAPAAGGRRLRYELEASS